MKKIVLLILFFAMLCNPVVLFAQTEPEDIAAVSDDFQESFFEALKQKGIENYDKAISALEKCQVLQPKNTAVLNELGKNYLLQKDYKKAYESFESATKIEPENKWFWNGMYEVCYQTQDLNQSIIIVEKLISFDKAYKEDLVSLYMKTQQFENALTLINELNDNVSKSEKRDLYKAQILTDPKFQGAERANLIDQIKKSPKEEANYISLINLYSKSNQEDKALEITKKLEIEIPTSDWAQVSLFKLYLNNNEGEKAVASMNKVLESNKIDYKIKHRMLNEFLLFVKNNPQYNADLEKAIGYFKDDKEINVAKEIGKFFQSKEDWNKAIQYYELDIKNNPNDIETALLLLESLRQVQQFDKMALFADANIELFPIQAELYYFSGLAYNQIKNFKKAKIILESGIDFVVDNKTLEINFNIQLGEAFNGLGDMAKKEIYFQKADKLLKQKSNE